MKKEVRNFSFDLLSLMEHQSCISVNGKEKKNINKKLLDPLNKTQIYQTSNLSPSEKKKRKGEGFELNIIEETDYEDSKKHTGENEEARKKQDIKGDDSIILEEAKNSTRLIKKKRKKRKNSCTLTKVENKCIQCESELESGFIVKDCNVEKDNEENEDNKENEETVNGMIKWDNILFTNYKNYYRNCPNCKLYLKELTKRMSTDVSAFHGYMHEEGGSNIISLRNKEIENLKKKNTELENTMHILKNRNLFLTSKVESISKNVNDLSQQYEKLIEENRILKDVNNMLSQKVHMRKMEKYGKNGNLLLNHSRKSKRNQGNAILKGLEEVVVVEEDKKEVEAKDEELQIEKFEEDESLDKEIFSN